MTQWIFKVDIKRHLRDDTTNYGVRTASRKILVELKAKLPKEWLDKTRCRDTDYELLHILTSLEFAQEDEEMGCEHFNYILSELYDWADGKRVWLGI